MDIHKKLRWKKLESNIVLSTPWSKIRLDKVALPNGITIDDYSVIELPSVAVVIAQAEKKKIILLRQYRHAIKKIIFELPAGTYDPKLETAEEAVTRELWQKTGYKASKLIKLGVFYEYPTKLSHTVTIFVAKNIHFAPLAQKDGTELLEIEKVSYKELVELVNKGQITTAGSVIATLLAKKYVET